MQLGCRQVLEREPEARLLLCAPGNFSADLLASALHAAGTPAAQLRRFVDPRWPPERVCCLCSVQYLLSCAELDVAHHAFVTGHAQP